MTARMLTLSVYENQETAADNAVSETHAIAWPGTAIAASYRPEGMRHVAVPTLETAWITSTGEPATASVLNPMWPIADLMDRSHELILVLGDDIEDRVIADLAFNSQGWISVGEPDGGPAECSVQIMVRDAAASSPSE